MTDRPTLLSTSDTRLLHWRSAVVGCALLLGFTAHAQVTIFSENMGTPSGTTAIATHDTNNGFQNSAAFTFTGTGDVRTSTASSGYAGASGGGNVFLTTADPDRFFQIDGIVTTGYTNISLSFGAYKNILASDLTELVVEYSTNGTSWSPLTFPAQPTGSGTANWRLITITGGTIPASATLSLRWTNTAASNQPRLDDIVLSGFAGAPCGITLGTAFTACDANTVGVDSYTLSIPYNGLDATTSVVNNSLSGTVGGDDPASVSNGTIVVSGITEGDAYSVTFTAPCNTLTVSGPSPTCAPACGIVFGTASAVCNSITAGPGDTYDVSIPYTGVEAGVTVVNNGLSGTIGGDDPAVTTNGTIVISGINESDAYSVTLSAPCAAQVASGSAPICDPLPLAAWDFNGEGNPGVATSTADIYNADLDASNLLTRGATAAASSAANSFRTTGFQNNGIATTNTDYFQATLSANAGFLLSLSSIDAILAGTTTFAASPGVSNQFAYSLDGTNFTLIGSPTVTIGSPATLQVDLSTVPALQNVSAGTTVTLRYYASGQTTTGGWGFSSATPGAYGLAIDGSLTPVGSCSLTLGTPTTSCDATTMGIDTYTLSIPYSGGQAGVSVVNNGSSGVIGGDDPSLVTDGTITISGITEGTSYDVGFTTPCELLSVTGGSPTCEPPCTLSFGTAVATCNTVTIGSSDTYDVSIPYTGSQAGVTVINGGLSGTVGGDDPAVVSNGTIVISGINETDGYSVSLSAPCGAVVSSGSAPGCTPLPIAAWDFTGENNLATSTADLYNANLDAAPLMTRGGGAGPSSGANSFRTTGFQNNGIATTNSDYFEVTLSSVSGQSVSLSSIDAIFNGTSSFAASPGVTSQFAYSLDGANFTLIGSPIVTIGQPATLPQVDLTGIAALQNVGPSTTITLRYYASGQTTTGGWGFNSPSSGIYGLAIGGSFAPVVGCDIILGAATATCNGVTPGDADTYDVSIPYTGSQAGISVVNNGASGTVAGDDPATTPNGTILITGISETDGYAISLSGDCSIEVVSGSAPSCDPLPTLVVNEVDYDQPSTDTQEFIELKNVGAFPVSLDGLELLMINGSGDAQYLAVALSNVTLAAGDYYVVGSASVPNVDQTAFTSNSLQNGNPDGIILRTTGGIIIDQMSYGGSMSTTEGTGTTTDLGGVAGVSISRVPDGNDTDDNSLDFIRGCATPGVANTQSDADEDGTPDCLDLCPGGPEPGSPCDDGLTSTADDVIQANCLCAGTPVDCEGTPGGGAVPGTPCDDFNPGTIDDVYQLDCTCAGVIVDCLGIPGGPNLPGAPCNDFDPSTNDETWQANCSCVGTPCSQNVVLDLRSDVNSDQISWEILYQNDGTVVCSGGSYITGITDPIVEACCLPIGCFRLRVNDSGGDGFVTGGYQLRESGAQGRRIIDNSGNFTSGSTSALAATYENGAFCVPIGDDKLIFSSCDRLDWVNNKFIVASANAAVSAQFGITNTTSGYEFWFFDPNGTYSYRRFRSHATSDGFGTGATRACHFKVNGWTNSIATPHLPANVLLNVRVRGRVAGTNLPFGQACLFRLDPVLAACPRVKLQDDPSNPSDFSCGVLRNFGGASNPNNRITANPPQPVPAVASSAVRYQFRFRIPGENVCIVRPPQTSARHVLNWTNGTPLECSRTYDVDVRVSLDGGATWCFGPATADEAAACSDPEAWGKVCTVSINPCAEVNGGANSMTLTSEVGFTMYPNPNRGQQLFLNLSGVDSSVNNVNVDIFDMTGKRVVARTLAVYDGYVNTSMELGANVSGGLYLVTVTAGAKTYTERLIVQP
ncbi:MAG: lamin tail domain-containing protein [Flavobacteriales bacterium]|nr:lamin tail domain-containing protein [Flavobacteriales bacterium]